MKQSWFHWRQIFLDDSRISYGAKGMGLFLHTYMNDNQDIAWPSIATICGRMGCGRTTAIKHIHELESLGWIKKEKRFGKSIIYHALVPQEILSSSDNGLVQEVNHSSSESEPSVVQNLNPNNQKNNQKNNQYSSKYSDEDKKFAEYFALKVSELPGQKKKTNLDKWADTVRLMRERDGHNHGEMRDLFDWANDDEFWRTNILSPEKLRKQWGQLVLKRESSSGRKKSNGSSTADNIFAI